MNAKHHTVKINLPGGIVAAGDLYDILTVARKAGARQVRFGNRQQLFFDVLDEMLEGLEYNFLQDAISYELNADEHPNIISSYVTEEIFPNSGWLSEGVYKDVLDQFNFKPRLKINLTDNNQTFIPFFTGNLNFIASEVSNYWYLHIRFPQSNTVYCWPVLIYSDDLPAISRLIENHILLNTEQFYDREDIDGTSLYHQITEKGNFLTQSITTVVHIPDFQLFDFEGFHPYDNKLWLGVYRRDELFPVDFLEEVCALCFKTHIGQVYVTPWKSIIIKGIETVQKAAWEEILSKYRINIHHSLTELNWQVEDQSDEGLRLKNHLARQFDEADLQTNGLCFAVKTRPKSGLFGSVIIRKQETDPEYFDILHTKDFNPNSRQCILYKQQVNGEGLFDVLATLCDRFYESRLKASSEDTFTIETSSDDQTRIQLHTVYRCKHCFTQYDETYGDTQNQVEAGTSFVDLDAGYTCPTCDAPKSDFLAAEKPLPVYL